VEAGEPAGVEAGREGAPCAAAGSANGRAHLDGRCHPVHPVHPVSPHPDAPTQRTLPSSWTMCAPPTRCLGATPSTGPPSTSQVLHGRLRGTARAPRCRRPSTALPLQNPFLCTKNHAIFCMRSLFNRCLLRASLPLTCLCCHYPCRRDQLSGHIYGCSRGTH